MDRPFPPPIRGPLCLGFAAFCLGPAAAVVLAATAFLDTFDRHAEGSSLAGAIPETGDSWTVEEGAFERQLVQSGVSRAGKALRLTRVRGEKQVLRGESDPRTARLTPGCTTILRADFYREDPAQAARLMLTPMGWPGFKPCIWVPANGTFHVWSCDGGNEWRGRWIDTGVEAGHGEWWSLEIAARWGEKGDNGRIEGVYDAFVTRHVPGKDPVRTRMAENTPTPGWPADKWVQLVVENYDFQQEEAGSVTFWDNVKLVVEPAP